LRHKLTQCRRIEQVNAQRVRELIGAPQRLAGAARTEQEKVILSEGQKSRDKCHNETQNGI
jgi:hypothetical protein